MGPHMKQRSAVCAKGTARAAASQKSCRASTTSSKSKCVHTVAVKCERMNWAASWGTRTYEEMTSCHVAVAAGTPARKTSATLQAQTHGGAVSAREGPGAARGQRRVVQRA